MDGGKPGTETPDGESHSVGRRATWVEASAKAEVDHVATRILAVVAAKWGENPHGLRGTVFPAIFVSRELAGPNPARNSAQGKGKRVNIPAPPRYMRQRKPARGRLGLGQGNLSAETRGEPSRREPGESVMSLLWGFG